ncbi:lipopolysaccharide biosynthesis protein [Marinilactibacillus piezotolerans]|uniref:lipopolysaccharide biosynthesis protein n=1 Tax=Marinilactibacillus piezotolerans TaxID=258723 RepID=UPI0009B0F13E|nr:lipopolysaccharide biosynthesis protein [Marinilactibacillus piezotolerans]
MSKNAFKTGILFSAFGKYSNFAINLLINSILSRILTPEDYGIITIVQIFLVFFDMLADMGFGPAVIQNRTLDDDDIGSIFKFSILVSILLGIFFALLGQPVNIFYDKDVFVPIFIILGFEIFFYGLMVVPRALLLKKKDFKSVNLLEVVSNIIYGIVAVALALLGFTYYSIILGRVVKIFCMFSFYFTHNKINYRAKLRKEPIIKIWAFARNQFLFNFINYFSRNLDNILIGRYIGSTALAFYGKSYQTSIYPNSLLAGILSPVIQPIMSDYQDRKHIIKDVYLRVVRLLGNLGIPLSIFCFFAAPDIIMFLFGDQWTESIPVFRILAISIWLQMIASSTGAFYQSANRTDLLLFSGIQSTILNVAAIIYGIYLGTIESVAIMVVISFTLNFVVNNYLLLIKTFESKYREVLEALAKPAVLGLIQLAIFAFLPTITDNPFINLVVKGTLFVIGLVVGLLVTKQLKEIVRLVKD